MEPIDLARRLPVSPHVLLTCPRCGGRARDWYGRYAVWSDQHEPHCRQCWGSDGVHVRLVRVDGEGGAA